MILVENVTDFKRHCNHYLNCAAAGEEILIQKGDMPFVKISPYNRLAAPWEPGALRGKIKVRPDFDAPSPEINHMFYGEG